MGLRLKFNLVLLGVVLVGFTATAAVSYRLLRSNAEDEVLRAGQLMMENALAIRGYTVNQVKPLLDPMLAERFLPQSVPAFSATETLLALEDWVGAGEVFHAALDRLSAVEIDDWRAESAQRIADYLQQIDQRAHRKAETS